MSALDKTKGLQPQPTKGRAVAERVFDSLQLLFHGNMLYNRTNPRQRPNLAVARDKTDNQLP